MASRPQSSDGPQQGKSPAVQLASMFGEFAGDESSGSSSHRRMQLESPSPPSSANASTPSSGQLPENVHLSMPAMREPQPAAGGQRAEKSAGASRTHLPSARQVPQEQLQQPPPLAGDRNQRRIVAAYNNQFASLLGHAPVTVSGESPGSLISGSSFNSPRTITLEELQQASRRTPQAATGRGKGKAPAWSQHTTPSPGLDRDSGLFGGQQFTFSSPQPASGPPTTRPGGFAPITEEEHSDDGAGRHRFDVHVPAPTSLARTPTLATRAATPSSSAAAQSIRRRATTASEDAVSPRASGDHSRSRSFGGAAATPLPMVPPLLPPPPADPALQFRSPFLAQQQARESDRESATRTRIRRRKPRNPSSVLSTASPSYTISSAYTPSNADSDLAYELTFLGLHPTVESPYSHSVLSRTSGSRPTMAGSAEMAPAGAGAASAADVRRRSSSFSSMAQPLPDDAAEVLRRERRRQLHTRSNSTDSSTTSSRVSSLRDGFEQLAAGGTPRPKTPSRLGDRTPGSPQVRDRIAEWRRAESRQAQRDSTSTGGTAAGTQQNIGRIESVDADASPAARAQSSRGRLVPLTPDVRSSTRASDQSSNAAPSLFGSDRSTFSTPLLAPLPGLSVPSNIPSLRAARAGPLDSALSSPVSVGGRKKQPLVVDALAATAEVLHSSHRVPSASPSVVHSPSSGRSRRSSAASTSASATRRQSADVIDSPPPALTVDTRHDWARQHPLDRPPLASSGSDDHHQPPPVPAARPLVADSPAALQPKSDGGLDPRPTSQKSRHSRRPSQASSTSSGDSAPVSPVSAGALSPADSGVGSFLDNPSRAHLRMGRHGSSPLNPKTTSGSTAPPLPDVPEAAVEQPGLFRRLTQRRVGPAQTPLPRRWWRNIRDSMYAPIPPLHFNPPQPQLQLQQPQPQLQQQQPGGPVRRHSFSGSTDIEQHRLAQALSPQENLRRKQTLAGRLRGMLRTRRPLPLPPQHPPSIAAPTGHLSLRLPQTVEHSGPASQLTALGAHNPFADAADAAAGLRRRASIDTLSVHEMAEVDRQDMLSRLNNLISPHQSAHPEPPESASLAESPQLGLAHPAMSSRLATTHPVAASSKFSFHADSPPPPLPHAGAKPLPQTPLRSAEPAAQPPSQVFSFPTAQELERSQEAPSPVFRVGGSSRPAPAAASSSGPSSAPEATEQPPSHHHNGGNDVRIHTAQIPEIVVEPVRKRPSLLKRMTAGWRDSQQPLQPASEGAAAAVSQAAVDAATVGVMSKLLGSGLASKAHTSRPPLAHVRQEGEGKVEPDVPNVSVVHSATPRASQYNLSHYPPEQQQQQPARPLGQHGYPQSIPESFSVDLDGAGPLPYQSTGNVLGSQQHHSSGPMHHSGSQPYHSSGPLQHPGASQAPMPVARIHSPPVPPLLAPDGRPHAPTPMPQHYPPMSPQLPLPPPQLPQQSKFMSTLASIPVVGNLFGRKNKKQQRHQQQPGPYVDSLYSGHGPLPYQPGHYPPGSSYYSRPPSQMTAYTQGPPPQHASPVGPHNILERLKSTKWYMAPAALFLGRRALMAEVAPLIGRYAMRYPLVEAEEGAARKAATRARADKGAVEIGGPRAVDVREFRHAAPGLNYSALDGRLEGAYVPRFSKLRKYRRAPEVWDDDEAHDIARDVQARTRGTVGPRRPGEPVLRGGGGRGVDREPILGAAAAADDDSRYSRDSRPAGQSLAYRLAGFLTRMMAPRQPAVRPQSQASYLDHSAADSRRHTPLIDPRPRGMSRIQEPAEPDRVNVRVEYSAGGGSGLVSDRYSHRGMTSNADAVSIEGSELQSLHRAPSLDEPVSFVAEKPQQQHEQQPDGDRALGGRLRRFFGGAGAAAAEPAARPGGDAGEYANAAVLNAAVRPPPEPTAEPAGYPAGPYPSMPAGPTESPMFPPFSHLPPRMVDQLMHRIGEPRVFVGSAESQLVPPDNGEHTSPLGDGSPYRTGTEWNFIESVKFSSPYPTSQRAVKNKKAWGRTGPRLLLKPRNNEISRWPLHAEIVRDYLQLLGVILGACGFVKAPLDSTVGDRWPWIIVAGIPDTLGFLWADLSTTTGKSVGFFAFFALVTAGALLMWTYGLYLERLVRPRPADAAAAAAKAEGAESKASDGDTGLVTYEEELVPAPGPFNIVGRVLSKVTRRQRMHAVYVVLTTLYIPMVKLCLEALVWGQGYWPVPNPYRATDRPSFPAAEDGMRDPAAFCYTTAMRTSAFNGAFVVLPLAALLLIALAVILPLQIHRLAMHHRPSVPGWADGSAPGHPVARKEAVAASIPAALDQAAGGPAGEPGSASTRDAERDLARDVRFAASAGSPGSERASRPRDGFNPVMDQMMQGAQGLATPEVMALLTGLYGMVVNSRNGAGLDLSHLMGLASKGWKRMQAWVAKSRDDPYFGMDRDEAYQARLRDMKRSHRNRHLATVQYRRALDASTDDFRFLYAAHYPGHAGDPARWLLWKLAVVAAAVVLAKDNCWARGRSRDAMDAARNVVLLLVALLLLRSHNSHRPFFDPTANLAALAQRLALLAAVAFAFPLFLLADPLSQAHRGLCVTLAVVNLLVLLAMLWLMGSALPSVHVAVRGPSAPLTLSPGILVATSAYDPRLRRLLIERVWQDTWSAILLASRDFRLLPNHRVAFCRTEVHPPYMVNYIGFAAERHLENLHLYDAIGRDAYCRAVQLERHNTQRIALIDEVVRTYTGPDGYFNPFETGEDPDRVAARFGVAQREVQSWFGKVYALHFPFTVCIVYDDLPGRIVPLVEEADLRTFLQQNADPQTTERRALRRKLRALHGQHVTLTYIEHAGPGGAHLRYCLPPFAVENEQYLAQFAGRRRILYRGVFRVHQHTDAAGAEQLCNPSAGFACQVHLTEEMYVDDEGLVNNLDRLTNSFRREFWRTGSVGSLLRRKGVSQRSRDALNVNKHNRHLLGITDRFDETNELRALLDENHDIIDERLPWIHDAFAAHQRDSHAGFVRKRVGLSPSFHIDVFAPGPESYHVAEMAHRGRPVVAATPVLATSINGQWHGDAHGRLSYLPTMDQLVDLLDRFEENQYMRSLLVDHKSDITLLYERLRTLVPSESNDPVKFAWYIFWDDVYRRYAPAVKQFKRHDADFSPLYPHALPYYPMPRHSLEAFLYARGLWRPLRSSPAGWWRSAFGGGGGGSARALRNADEEYAMGLMPVSPGDVPGVVPGSTYAKRAAGDARLWTADQAATSSTADLPFAPAAPASGFIHSGLLNRLYTWLDTIAYGTSR